MHAAGHKNAILDFPMPKS
jgi:hypothetical protein